MQNGGGRGATYTAQGTNMARRLEVLLHDKAFSREALAEYRRSVEVPGGILIFRSVGAEPTLSIFEVAASIRLDM